jgi:hypothetical protein
MIDELKRLLQKIKINLPHTHIYEDTVGEDNCLRCAAEEALEIANNLHPIPKPTQVNRGAVDVG